MLMTFGQTGMIHPSLAGMVEAIQAKISRVALHFRFTEKAVDFLTACLKIAIETSVHSVGIQPKALKAFNRVLIFDSSRWDIDPQLKHILPGSGGGASDANCKLQAGYEYKTGTLGFFAVTEGIRPDQDYSRCLSDFVKTGDLMLADLGYFKLTVFQALATQGAFFLSRFLVGTTLHQADTQNKMDLIQRLQKCTGNFLEMNVLMGKDESKVACRLICLRVREEVGNTRRMKLYRRARKNGHTPSQMHLTLCDWTLFVTNATADMLPCERILTLYRLRWQIELIFKQLKSVLRIHVSNTANEYRLKCELYGKLIMAVLTHCFHASLNEHLWNTQSREISFDKFYKRVQERAFFFLRQFLLSVSDAIKTILREIRKLARACIKSRQPSRKTTLELLEISTIPDVS